MLSQITEQSARMTAWTFTPAFFAAPPARQVAERPAPKRQPRSPVFVQDCASPYDGSTMLLALLRRDADLADDA